MRKYCFARLTLWVLFVCLLAFWLETDGGNCALGTVLGTSQNVFNGPGPAGEVTRVPLYD